MVCIDSLAATMLSAARGALSEQHPVTSDIISLSALTGARARTAGDAVTVEKKDRR
jgi:hypothetical protein